MQKLQIIVLAVLILLVAINGVVLFVLLGQFQIIEPTAPPDWLVCVSEEGTVYLCFFNETEATHFLGETVSNYGSDFIYLAPVEIDGKPTHVVWVEIAREKR